METYSLIVLLSAAAILVTALMLVHRHNKQQQDALREADLDQETLQQIELIRVQNPSQKDLQAYHLIETERLKVWKSLSTGTSLAPHKLSQMSLELIKNIAVIYFPETENPVFQVSLADLVELNERIVTRIHEHLEDFPLNTIKDLKIQEVLKYKSYYDAFTQFKMVKLAQKHTYLYTLGRYAWMGYNALNPWYWGKKVILTAGKEGALRYLLTMIITIVGEEAVLVYSKRHIRTKATAVEKQIAFEMINMAIADNIVSQEEYEVILEFVLNNPRFSSQLKVTLLKALLRKRLVKSEISLEVHDEKERKRILTEVERVAKADKFGILKKREALRTLEEALQLTSEYRTQLELAPHEEVHSWEIMQQHRRREEALLRLMVQAGALNEPFPDSLQEYIIQRAESYPLPFDEDEQARILRECIMPSSPDALTNLITTKSEKERTISEVLDALFWYLPFTRKKEEFYTQIISALDLKKQRDKFLLQRFERLLPVGKLIEKPPVEVLKALFRAMTQEEQLLALLESASMYQFMISGEKSKKKEAPYWVCVTTTRVFTLAAVMVDQVLYDHLLEFQKDFVVELKRGKLSDTYVLRDANRELHLKSALFHSSNLEKALKPHLLTPKQENVLHA
ncbi:hypothetical protein U27_02657 [Candidatus Vecturithrix granuli]|uniref:Uncharacterized protein n=1 Tax=Vecturithrix granuli TaxID=1499967 RepID=A0A081BTP5_VECG1|nr:hypothetical protein U27_02657 [Candidatus Vecturithrix granuli]